MNKQKKMNSFHSCTGISEYYLIIYTDLWINIGFQLFANIWDFLFYSGCSDELYKPKQLCCFQYCYLFWPHGKRVSTLQTVPISFYGQLGQHITCICLLTDWPDLKKMAFTTYFKSHSALSSIACYIKSRKVLCFLPHVWWINLLCLETQEIYFKF